MSLAIRASRCAVDLGVSKIFFEIFKSSSKNINRMVNYTELVDWQMARAIITLDGVELSMRLRLTHITVKPLKQLSSSM